MAEKTPQPVVTQEQGTEQKPKIYYESADNKFSQDPQGFAAEHGGYKRRKDGHIESIYDPVKHTKTIKYNDGTTVSAKLNSDGTAPVITIDDPKARIDPWAASSVPKQASDNPDTTITTISTQDDISETALFLKGLKDPKSRAEFEKHHGPQTGSSTINDENGPGTQLTFKDGTVITQQGTKEEPLTNGLYPPKLVGSREDDSDKVVQAPGNFNIDHGGKAPGQEKGIYGLYNDGTRVLPGKDGEIGEIKVIYPGEASDAPKAAPKQAGPQAHNDVIDGVREKLASLNLAPLDVEKVALATSPKVPPTEKHQPQVS